MSMVVIAKEDLVRNVIFAKYRTVAAFNLGKGTGSATNSNGKEIEYEKLNFLPDEDTINAIKAGDMTLKSVIKRAIKALYNPKAKNTTIGLGVAQLITLITSDRKAKRGIPVIAFITDEEDPVRNKILVKFITAILGEFGIKVLSDKSKIKRIFEKRKKARRKVAAYCSKEKNGCTLSQEGVALKKRLYLFYEMELRQSAMANMDLVDLGKSDAEACIKTMLSMYTGENLKNIKKKLGKKLAKKDEIAADAYNSLRDIMRIINPNLKLPKVEYGQKKKGKGKKKRAVGAKMNTKKFKKFFTKRSNRPLIIIIYGHSLALLVGIKIGSKEYNDHMKTVCSVFKSDFAKQYASAVSAYVKGKDSAAK